jgi:CRISPR-associated endoribonuclease Cas6
MFNLKFTSLVANLEFPEYRLPYWMGNKFRGGFGSVLLKAVCGFLKPECKNCGTRTDCLYYALYVQDRQKIGKSQPVRPIIFIPPFFGKSVEGSGALTLRINVFGDFIQYIPHIVYGVRYLGKTGLNTHSKYVLTEIKDLFTGELVYDGNSVNIDCIKSINLDNLSGRKSGIIKINFLTPFELEKIPLGLDHLIHMVRRRLILYVNEYGKGNVPDYKCDDKIVRSSLKKHKLFHRSKRFGKRFFTGYTGEAEYEAKLDKNGRKLLRIGELVGAGSKSSFGMGFYEISES